MVILAITLLILLSLLILAVAGIVFYYIQNKASDEEIKQDINTTTPSTIVPSTIVPSTIVPSTKTSTIVPSTTTSSTIVPSTTTSSTIVPSTTTSSNGSLCLQYSEYNKDGVEIMNLFQEILLEMQKEGCAQLMETYDFEKISTQIREYYNAQDLPDGIPCGLAIFALKTAINSPDDPDAIYYQKTIKLINPLIEKIIELSCSNGKIDVDKLISLILIMKNTFCGNNIDNVI